MNVNKPQGPRLPGMELRDTGAPSNVGPTGAVALDRRASMVRKTSFDAVSPALREQVINVRCSHPSSSLNAMHERRDSRSTLGELVAKHILHGLHGRAISSGIDCALTPISHTSHTSHTQQRNQTTDHGGPAQTAVSKGGSVDDQAGKI